MLNDLSNLLKSLVRIIVIGGALLFAALWLFTEIADTPLLPILLGALPVILVLWAFWPKKAR